MRAPAIAFLAVLGCLGSGCHFDLWVVEIESREVCIGNLEAEIPADADGVVTTTLSDEDAETAPEDADEAFELPDDFEIVEVTLLGITVTATEGVNDLAFVSQLHVDMSGRVGGLELPEVRILEFVHPIYNSGPSTNRDGPLWVDGNTDVDVADYFSADEVELTLEVGGQMPEVDWAVDVEPCFTFIAEYREDL